MTPASKYWVKYLKNNKLWLVAFICQSVSFCGFISYKQPLHRTTYENTSCWKEIGPFLSQIMLRTMSRDRGDHGHNLQYCSVSGSSPKCCHGLLCLHNALRSYKSSFHYTSIQSCQSRHLIKPKTTPSSLHLCPCLSSLHNLSDILSLFLTSIFLSHCLSPCSISVTLRPFVPFATLCLSVFLRKCLAVV